MCEPLRTFTMGPDVRINSPTPNGQSDHGPSRNSRCFSSSMDFQVSLASPSRQVMLCTSCEGRIDSCDKQSTYAQDVCLSLIGYAIRCAPSEYTFNIVRCAFRSSGVGDIPPVCNGTCKPHSACGGLCADLRKPREAHRLMAE